MEMIFWLLAMLANLGLFGCAVFVAIQMNAKEGALKAILGFFCAIYGYIWGWMNRDAHPQMPTVMLVYTGCFVAAIVFQTIAQSMMMSSLSQ